MSEYDLKEVIDFMRDATGQSAQGLHLLRLKKLCLDCFALAEVTDNTFCSEYRAIYISVEACGEGRYKC